MKTRTEIEMPVKLLSGLLLSVALAIPMVAEAGRGHHRHHHNHHNHYRHQQHNHHNHYRHYQHHNHYNTRNIYYNQPYYPSAYSGGYYRAAPGNFLMGVNTGNASFMLGF